MSYRLYKSHLLICIFAALMLTGGFVWQMFFSIPIPFIARIIWICSGIVIFYFIGHIARAILINDVFKRRDEYNFEEDEEYQAFVASLESNEMAPMNVMLDDPIETVDYDDTLNDPFMEPVSLDDAS